MLFFWVSMAVTSCTLVGGRDWVVTESWKGGYPSLILKVGMFLKSTTAFIYPNSQVIYFGQLPVQHVLDAWPEEECPHVLGLRGTQGLVSC